MRFVIACALALGSIWQRPVLEARFIGNMAFAITDGAFTLMSDFPYQSGYSRYMEYAAENIRSSTPVTLSLITHRHGDHWEPALFTKNTDWRVAGPNDVIASAPAHRVVPLSEAKTMFGPIEIERIETPHANIGHYSYVVTWHGKRLYFSGDTESSASLRAATNLDVAFVSPWVYRAIVKNNHAVDARRIVIYHHEAGESIAECRDRCSVPQQGDTIAIN